MHHGGAIPVSHVEPFQAFVAKVVRQDIGSRQGIPHLGIHSKVEVNEQHSYPFFISTLYTFCHAIPSSLYISAECLLSLHF